MAEFASWRSYWSFERAVRTERRHIFTADIQTFLATVLATATSRIQVIPSAKYLWRAQWGNDWIEDEPAPHPPDRMKPLGNRSSEGRANPKGIAYFYLATQRDTAMAEVRPWIGSLVSVGQFKTLRELRLVNCSSDATGHRIYIGGEPSPAEREESVWADIDRAFAAPVDRSDDSADYAPTQILAELFKANEFDGIAYRSSLGPGHNIALFDLTAAELVGCGLFEVKSITLEYEQAANPYVIKQPATGEPTGEPHQ